MDLGPERRRELPQAFTPDEAGRLRHLLEHFQELGMPSQRDVQRIREPKTTSRWRRLLDDLEGRLEAYERDAGRSTEQLKKVAMLKGLIAINRMRHGMR